MNEEGQNTVVMSCLLRVGLIQPNQPDATVAEAKAEIENEMLNVAPKLKPVMRIPFRDILEMKKTDHRLFLSLSNGETLVLSHMGYRYDDFTKRLKQLWNDVVLKDMLMHETMIRSGVSADCQQRDTHGLSKTLRCEPRLYRSALVMIFEHDDPIRLPYSMLTQIKPEDFRLHIETEFGDTYILAMMGRQYQPFVQTLVGILEELSIETQTMLKTYLPSASFALIRQASELLKEGKAAQRRDLDSISPDLWTNLESTIESGAISVEYDHLKTMAKQTKMCIGIKRGLMGDLTGEYIWFLIPIYDQDTHKPGNAIAMETIAKDGTGQATYFFKIMNRSDYANTNDVDTLDHAADQMLKQLNHALLAINFRREPIYIPDEKLNEERYRKHQFSIARIPELQLLRKHFIGRVMHVSKQQWIDDVTSLLTFHVSTNDDTTKWKKG